MLRFQLMVPKEFFLIHTLTLLILAVAVVSASITFIKLRNTPATYNATLVPFAYFSLSSWILWILQYAILLAAPFTPFPNSYLSNFSDLGLWLGIMQNALWASAVLTLLLNQFSRTSPTQSFLPMAPVVLFPLLAGLVIYQTTVLTSGPLNDINTASAAIIFGVLAIWIWQLRLSRISAAAFLLHGYSQWIWRSLWLTPFDKISALLLAFPLCRITLLFAWIKLTSEMLQRALPSYQKFGKGNERPELPKLLVPLKAMISSTVDDLVQEREAADRAIVGLNLTRFRAETFGSVPQAPQIICALLAEQCDIFVLIIGERYGYIIKSEGMSVVQFEYQVARAQNPEKIFVYVKDGVKREPRLEEFLTALQDFEHGYFRSLFTTPEDLFEKIQRDVLRWLASQVNQNKPREA